MSLDFAATYDSVTAEKKYNRDGERARLLLVFALVVYTRTRGHQQQEPLGALVVYTLTAPTSVVVVEAVYKSIYKYMYVCIYSGIYIYNTVV